MKTTVIAMAACLWVVGCQPEPATAAGEASEASPESMPAAPAAPSLFDFDEEPQVHELTVSLTDDERKRLLKRAIALGVSEEQALRSLI